MKRLIPRTGRHRPINRKRDRELLPGNRESGELIFKDSEGNVRRLEGIDLTGDLRRTTRRRSRSYSHHHSQMAVFRITLDGGSLRNHAFYAYRTVKPEFLGDDKHLNKLMKSTLSSYRKRLDELMYTRDCNQSNRLLFDYTSCFTDDMLDRLVIQHIGTVDKTGSELRRLTVVDANSCDDPRGYILLNLSLKVIT